MTVSLSVLARAKAGGAFLVRELSLGTSILERLVGRSIGYLFPGLDKTVARSWPYGFYGFTGKKIVYSPVLGSTSVTTRAFELKVFENATGVFPAPAFFIAVQAL